MSDLSELAFNEEGNEPLQPATADESETLVRQSGGRSPSCRRASIAAASLAFLGLMPAAVFFLRSRGLALDQMGGGPTHSDVAVQGSSAAPMGLSVVKTPLKDPHFCVKEYKHTWGCTQQAKINKKIGYWKCCHDAILPKILFHDQKFENFVPPMTTCALVGSSSLLKGKWKGKEIDSHSVVIRINRIPKNGYKEDFGEKASIIMMAVTHQLTGKITLMGEGDGVMTPCDWNPNCKYSGLTFLQGRHQDCPLKTLTNIWKLENHHFIGCTHKDLVELAYHFKTRTGQGWVDVTGPLMSTGFVAILQFAPLCQTLDVYGFGGTATADGHIEWDGHPLGLEHIVEHQLAGRRYWDLDVREGYMRPFWSQWKKHAGHINMK